ncbi:SGNH/GDSL hydrolase family protein [Aerosakkonema sp. BLCC-F183]|uniref:SGNH/GDSL hydrolase family protein n=1 Tax=Aerosakkonema sp. BLCC-F183 TaxID=3342834 RepID=UPI0035B8FC96
MKDKISLVFINLLTVAFFLAVINFFSNKIVDIYFVKTADTGGDRSYLINYADDKDFAKIHFKELSEGSTLQYSPTVGWSRIPVEYKTFHVDTNGYRIDPTPVDYQPNSKSFYFFGGSTMWGYGVRDNETIPALFSSISGIHSYNRGEIGYTSRQLIDQFINVLVAGDKIDAAVFYDGVNDIYVSCDSHFKIGDNLKTNSIRSAAILAKRTDVLVLNLINRIFFDGSRKLAGEILRPLSDPKIESGKTKSTDGYYVCDNLPERAQKVAERLIKDWEIAHDIAEAEGIKFLAVLQPVASIGNPKLDHLNFPELDRELLLQYKFVYPLIKDIIQERGYDWILDYTDIFSRDEYIYTDFAHVSKNGNLIVAKQLFNDILKLPAGEWGSGVAGERENEIVERNS